MAGVRTASPHVSVMSSWLSLPTSARHRSVPRGFWLEFKSPGIYVVDVVGSCLKGFGSQNRGSLGVLCHSSGIGIPLNSLGLSWEMPLYPPPLESLVLTNSLKRGPFLKISVYNDKLRKPLLTGGNPSAIHLPILDPFLT